MRSLAALLLALPLPAVTWNARWIAPAEAPPFDYGVYHFRRAFDLAAQPSTFAVHVSADNRYQLFVNGKRVVWGPARGDLHHWRYETVDLAPHLHAGRNVLAAVVWNFSTEAPMAQITERTAFLLQGDGAAEQVANSGRAWKCIRDEAYRPLITNLRAYYVAGPGEEVDGARYPWGWEAPDYDDSAWRTAALLDTAAARDARDAHSPWMLVPRTIPLMEESPERVFVMRRPDNALPLHLGPHFKGTFLLDQTYLTTAYPELIVSGGAGATVSLRYAESLFLPGPGNNKGNRNEIEGKEFRGYQDIFRPDGGAHRMFRPLWWRTYRYIELGVETRDAPIEISLEGAYTGYPFLYAQEFEAGSKELQTILHTGFRTARLCAHETYMDCPYYEQLQYVGDTRVQALVSYYATGDARLARNAIKQIDDSRTAEGATYSRAPSRLQQYIPPFSLWWIGMVHDYWMYQDDPAFVARTLPGVRAVLSFFAARRGSLPWWNYIDWVKQWPGGVPPSNPVDLQLLLAYQWAAEMESALGSPALAAEDRRAAAALPQGKLYGDSQHSNALAILAGLVEGDAARDLIRRTIEDTSLPQCSIYFRHYLHSALNKAGEGDRYLDLLDPWRRMLQRGLTTWSEQEDPTRSDCHAWGASPNFELFRTVLGIDSAAPGFRRVVVRPFLGKLTHARGSIPHPKGRIEVSLNLRGGKLEAEVTLPAGIDGDFVWRGQHRALKPGRNALVL
jgi:alpha-L-rhamnosidase